MSTENLNLELIELSDTIRNDFINKMNNNLVKIDEKYGQLKLGLLEQTEKDTLEEAIAYIQTLADSVEYLRQAGDALASDILTGKQAVVRGQVITGNIPVLSAQTITPSTSNHLIQSGRYLGGLVTVLGDSNLKSANIIEGKTIFNVSGTAKKRVTINTTLDSSASSTYAGYISGYGAGIDHNGNLVIWAMSNSTAYEHINFVAQNIIGTAGNGFGITSFDTSDPTSVPHACTISGLANYSTLNITLKPTAVNSSYDYITVQVTVTGS